MSRSRWSPLFALVCAAPALAVPTTITYAGYLTNDGAPVDGPVDIVVELYNDRTGGTALFTETFASTVVPDGDLVIELGTQTPLDTAVLDTAELWLEIAVDGTVLAPRARLSSVPYALLAGEAASLEGLSAADIQSQIDALSAQIADAQTQLTSLQASLTALGSAGGPPVAFANLTGLADAITGAHIAPLAVSTSELADSSVTSAKLVGTEQTVYERPLACGEGLTRTANCVTTLCKDGSNNVRYYACTGTCTRDTAEVCNLVASGKILANAN